MTELHVKQVAKLELILVVFVVHLNLAFKEVLLALIVVLHETLVIAQVVLAKHIQCCSVVCIRRALLLRAVFVQRPSILVVVQQELICGWLFGLFPLHKRLAAVALLVGIRHNATAIIVRVYASTGTTVLDLQTAVVVVVIVFQIGRVHHVSLSVCETDLVSCKVGLGQAALEVAIAVVVVFGNLFLMSGSALHAHYLVQRFDLLEFLLVPLACVEVGVDSLVQIESVNRFLSVLVLRTLLATLPIAVFDGVGSRVGLLIPLVVLLKLVMLLKLLLNPKLLSDVLVAVLQFARKQAAEGAVLVIFLGFLVRCGVASYLVDGFRVFESP